MFHYPASEALPSDVYSVLGTISKRSPGASGKDYGFYFATGPATDVTTLDMFKKLGDTNEYVETPVYSD